MVHIDAATVDAAAAVVVVGGGGVDCDSLSIETMDHYSMHLECLQQYQ